MSEALKSAWSGWVKDTLVVLVVGATIGLGLNFLYQSVMAPSSGPVVLEQVRDKIVLEDEPAVTAQQPKDEVMTVSLDSGSNPWETVENILAQENAARKAAKEPALALSLKEAVRKVCLDSGVAVPEWGLTNGEDHEKLDVGFELKVNLTQLRVMASSTQTGVRG